MIRSKHNVLSTILWQVLYLSSDQFMQSKSLSILHSDYNALQHLSCCVTFTTAQTLDTILTNRIKHKHAYCWRIYCIVRMYLPLKYTCISFLDAQAFLSPWSGWSVCKSYFHISILSESLSLWAHHNEESKPGRWSFLSTELFLEGPGTSSNCPKIEPALMQIRAFNPF